MSAVLSFIGRVQPRVACPAGGDVVAVGGDFAGDDVETLGDRSKLGTHSGFMVLQEAKAFVLVPRTLANEGSKPS